MRPDVPGVDEAAVARDEQRRRLPELVAVEPLQGGFSGTFGTALSFFWDGLRSSLAFCLALERCFSCGRADVCSPATLQPQHTCLYVDSSSRTLPPVIMAGSRESSGSPLPGF